MARVKLEDGRVLNFQGNPTQEDIDDAVSQLNITPQKNNAVDTLKSIDIGKSIKNIPSSAIEFGKSISNVISHPIDTAKTLSNIVEPITPIGMAKKSLESITSGTKPELPTKSLEPIFNFLKDRYGSAESIKKTIENDPVGFAADLSTILTGSGSAIGATSKIAEAGEMGKAANILGKTGNILSKAGESVEPLNIAGKGINLAGKGISEALGITTGAGGEVIRQAFTKRNPSFVKAMRGEISESQIVDDAKQALSDLKEQRGIEYAKQLPKAVNNPLKFDTELAKLKQELNQKISDFKIKIKDDGTLDFSRSPVAKSGQEDIVEAVDKVKNWGTQPGDFSVEGLDTLKRQLDDLIPKTGAAKAFITSLKSRVRNTLVNNVQDYKKLVNDYENATNTLNELGSTFSIGGKASADTIIRKLNQSLRQNFELRQKMLQKLDESTGGDLISQIAGSQLKPIAPRGLARTAAQFTATGGAYGVGSGAISIPLYLGTLALSSPRLIGETLSILGIPASYAAKIINELGQKVTPGIRSTAFQVGRIQKELKK